jgi:homoserine acetyltransferase
MVFNITLKNSSVIYIVVAVSFIGGGNRSTLRKPPTCRTSPKPFPLKYNSAVLPEVTIVYETWGKLNENKDNVVLIHAGLSASSHAKSHEVSVIHESITWF